MLVDFFFFSPVVCVYICKLKGKTRLQLKQFLLNPNWVKKIKALFST